MIEIIRTIITKVKELDDFADYVPVEEEDDTKKLDNVLTVIKYILTVGLIITAIVISIPNSETIDIEVKDYEPARTFLCQGDVDYPLYSVRFQMINESKYDGVTFDKYSRIIQSAADFIKKTPTVGLYNNGSERETFRRSYFSNFATQLLIRTSAYNIPMNFYDSCFSTTNYQYAPLEGCNLNINFQESGEFPYGLTLNYSMIYAKNESSMRTSSDDEYFWASCRSSKSIAEVSAFKIQTYLSAVGGFYSTAAGAMVTVMTLLRKAIQYYLKRRKGEKDGKSSEEKSIKLKSSEEKSPLGQC